MALGEIEGEFDEKHILRRAYRSDPEHGRRSAEEIGSMLRRQDYLARSPLSEEEMRPSRGMAHAENRSLGTGLGAAQNPAGHEPVEIERKLLRPTMAFAKATENSGRRPQRPCEPLCSKERQWIKAIPLRGMTLRMLAREFDHYFG
jgi:hypothetical protein